MRLIGAAATVFILALTLSYSAFPTARAQQFDGQQIFRFDTFEDEQLWTDVLRLNESARDPSAGNCAGGWPQDRR